MAKFLTDKKVPIAIAALLAGALGGCYGRGTDEADTYAIMNPDMPATFAEVNAMIFQPLCAKCHAGVFDSEQDLLSHAKFVVPGQPDGSMVMQMVESGEMPKGGPKLNESQCDLIRRYIEQIDVKPAPVPKPIPTPSPSSSPAPEPTYTWLSANLFNVSCMGCHSTATQKGGIILDTYADAKANASDALSEIQTADMPPDDSGKPTPSAAATAALQEWINQGYPQ